MDTKRQTILVRLTIVILAGLGIVDLIFQLDQGGHAATEITSNHTTPVHFTDNAMYGCVWSRQYFVLENIRITLCLYNKIMIHVGRYGHANHSVSGVWLDSNEWYKLLELTTHINESIELFKDRHYNTVDHIADETKDNTKT